MLVVKMIRLSCINEKCKKERYCFLFHNTNTNEKLQLQCHH
nr:MAG TPA: hypothetical protein [Caudoviricetes sp.]